MYIYTYIIWHYETFVTLYGYRKIRFQLITDFANDIIYYFRDPPILCSRRKCTNKHFLLKFMLKVYICGIADRFHL